MISRTFKIIILLLFTNAGFAQFSLTVTPVFPAVSNYTLFDVRLQQNTSINYGDKALSLFVFLSPECPLCQNYTSTLNKIYQRFQQNLNVFGIVPGNAYNAKEVIDFGKKYSLDFKLFIDPKLELTNYLKASITPQAIILNSNGQLVYTGAIDDWVISLGKKRLQVTEHYVEDAIEQSLQFTPVAVSKTKAIGCLINDY